MSAGLAVVVFSDAAALPWLRWLRPGFRHCFVAVPDGDAWLVLDPLAHRLHLAHGGCGPAAAVAAHYRARGLVALVVRRHEPPRRAAPLAAFTCVETVKRVLGLHRRWIFTPYQLFRYLKKNSLDFCQ